METERRGQFFHCSKLPMHVSQMILLQNTFSYPHYSTLHASLQEVVNLWSLISLICWTSSSSSFLLVTSEGKKMILFPWDNSCKKNIYSHLFDISLSVLTYILLVLITLVKQQFCCLFSYLFINLFIYLLSIICVFICLFLYISIYPFILFIHSFNSFIHSFIHFPTALLSWRLQVLVPRT